MIPETQPKEPTTQEIIEILYNFDKVLTAYMFHLDTIYDSDDSEEIIVCWECLQKIVSVHGGHEVLNEYITEGKGKYNRIKTKLKRLGLI